MTPLSERLVPVATWNPAAAGPGQFDYIDLSSVDQRTKRIVAATQMPNFAAPSRARQLVQAGDVLVSTVRPSLNGVAVVPPHLDGATASTGFTVLRAGGSLDTQYLFHWVRSPAFVEALVRQATGASYPAVSDRMVKASQIPLPAIGEQRQIAATLDLAEVIRDSRRRTLDLLACLPMSALLERFGDPLENHMKLDVARLGELGEWRSGGTPPRSQPTYFEGEIPWFSSGELGPLFVSESREHVSEAALQATSVKSVPPGALMVGMYDTAALKSSIAKLSCSCNQAIAFVELDRALADPLYVYFALQIAKERLKARRRGIRQKNLNLSIVRAIEIALPPIRDQLAFARRVQAIEAQRAAAQRSLETIDELFSSLQARAFSGQL